MKVACTLAQLACHPFLARDLLASREPFLAGDGDPRRADPSTKKRSVVTTSMSLKPVVGPLSKAVGRPVEFADDCIGSVAEAAVAKLKDGEVLLLENTRFHAGEDLGTQPNAAS